MNTKMTQVLGESYKAGGCENIISFAGYVARHGRKSSYQSLYRDNVEENNLVRLAGCDVVDLADRRS